MTTALTAIAACVAAFAALFSAAASWTSARIARSQRELAERQYALQRRQQEVEEVRAKRELYERRLSVYQAVKVILDAFQPEATFEPEDLEAFSRNTAEGDFLFEGQEIPDYLKDIVAKKASQLTSLNKRLSDYDHLPISEERTRYENEASELRYWFDDQYTAAKEKFKPYLDIGTPTP
jgi:hypothetical protein